MFDDVFRTVDLNSSVCLSHLHLRDNVPKTEPSLYEFRQSNRTELLAEEVSSLILILSVISASSGIRKEFVIAKSFWILFYLIPNLELVWILKVVKLLGKDVRTSLFHINQK